MTSLSGYCLLCRQQTAQALCCQHCEQDLQPISNRCQSCGCLLPDTNDTVCGECQTKPPVWQGAQVAFCYDDTLKHLIYQLKFARQEQVAGLLARLFLQRVKIKHRPDYIISVPLHWQRKWLRGYNQADLLAKHMAQELGCTYLCKLLSRRKRTKPQAKLARKTRLSNLTRAFVCQPQAIPPHARLALVDDVLTTGATLKSACRAIKKQYPETTVEIWTICRA